jgi:hypothetical protein
MRLSNFLKSSWSSSCTGPGSGTVTQGEHKTDHFELGLECGLGESSSFDLLTRSLTRVSIFGTRNLGDLDELIRVAVAVEFSD